MTRRVPSLAVPGPRPWKGRPQGVAQRREYRTEPEAREERTGLGGAGVALGWADPAGWWNVAGRRPAPLGAQRRNANRTLCWARAVLTAAEAKTRRSRPARRVLVCWAASAAEVVLAGGLLVERGWRGPGGQAVTVVGCWSG
jgi:hypothetical protein